MIRAVLAFFILLSASILQAQTTDGHKSLIPRRALNAARKTKYRVLVPTYVPAGFKLDSCDLKVDKEPMITDWAVSYRNPKTKATILLQMASEGLGDPILELPEGKGVETSGSIWAKSPILGKVEVMYLKRGKLKAANCTWYKVSTKTFPTYAMILSEGVEAVEIKRMLESLRWLSK